MKQLLGIKKLTLLLTVLALCSLTGCGSGSSTANPNSVTGTWTVNVYDSNGAAIYVFTTKLNQAIASPSTTSDITGSGLNMTTKAASCFSAATDAQQTGIYTVNDNFNGLTTNTVRLAIKGTDGSSTPATLNLTGTFTTNAVSGPWTLTTTGTGCVTSGVFLMSRS